MKRINFLSIFIFLSFSLVGQENTKQKNTPPPPPRMSYAKGSDSNPNFGKYYKIGEYGIQVPFNKQPNISPISENAVCKITSYQYAYPKPSDDINLVYGIDVCQFKIDTIVKDSNSKIDFLVNDTKKMYEYRSKGNLIKEEKNNSNGKYFIIQKMKINIPNIGETYVTSLYFLYNGLVIRLFVFTANDINNHRINEFFNSIKLH